MIQYVLLVNRKLDLALAQMVDGQYGHAQNRSLTILSHNL